MLGSTLAEDGEFDAEVTQRAQSGWKNWNRVSICCVVRQKRKRQGGDVQDVGKLAVPEIRIMLRWMCRVTKLENIRNEKNNLENESPRKEVEVVRAEKRGSLRRKEGNGNKSTREKEEWKT